MAEEEKKEEAVTEQDDKKKKIIFWIRFGLWILTGLILPCVFLIWRFNLFQPTSKIAIGGWGVVVILLAFLFVTTLVGYFKRALGNKSIMINQCISGFLKIVLPLIIVLLILKVCRDNLDLIMQAIGAIAVCEAMAIPINPMPKWEAEHEEADREEKQENFLEKLWNKFFSKKKENE